ncbi:hypothetical protein [Streptomyces sp. bgisy100]|uniref:hypothetical protein n=1 Tax=Streptomyces sp. bgisy100 TaxID=3413783 RepID=UPI003D72D98D
MKRRIRPVAVAIAASTALLLTGCGSGESGDGSPGTSAGEGSGSEKGPASPGASAKPDRGERPKTELPKSFQAHFEGWKNSDPELQALLDDGKERLLASYGAIINQDPHHDAFTFYDTGDALRTGTTWIKAFTDKNLTLIGKGRVFQPQPRIGPDGSGTLSYCVDEGKGSTKDMKTGEVTDTPADDAFVLYRTELSRTDEGVWRTTMVRTEKGACK